MAKSYDLKPAPLNDEKAYAAGGASVVNRRQFLRYGFNAAGFTHHTPLDVRYEPRGTFDGLPLYRQTGCGPAAMCK